VEGIAELRPKYYIDSIFPSLDDPDPAVASTTSDTLEQVFGQQFESSEEASGWWGSNHGSFDEQLNQVESE